jgi:hypothetical protein
MFWALEVFAGVFADTLSSSSEVFSSSSSARDNLQEVTSFAGFPPTPSPPLFAWLCHTYLLSVDRSLLKLHSLPSISHWLGVSKGYLQDLLPAEQVHRTGQIVPLVFFLFLKTSLSLAQRW